MAKVKELVFGGKRLEEVAAKLAKRQVEAKEKQLEKLDRAFKQVEEALADANGLIESTPEEAREGMGQELVPMQIQLSGIKNQRAEVAATEEVTGEALRGHLIEMLRTPIMQTPPSGRATPTLIAIVHLSDAFDEFLEGDSPVLELKQTDYNVLKDEFDGFAPKEVQGGVIPAWQNMNVVRMRIFALAHDILHEATDKKEE